MPKPVKPKARPPRKAAETKERLEKKLALFRGKVIKRMKAALHVALDRELVKADDALVQAYINKFPYRVNVEFLIPEEVPAEEAGNPYDEGTRMIPTPPGIVDQHGNPLQ
jgi:hypothetical protein